MGFASSAQPTKAGDIELKIAIVAGETSGDLLGAGLLAALKRYYPDLQAEGIAGPQMQVQGCQSLFDIERLSVMGFVEPLSRLPELIKIRKSLIKRFTENPPDVFIGIDAPAFNIGLEYHLKKAGIKTVQFVSPSVWAWRKKRIFKIKKAVDLILTLFPFENKIYDQHRVRNCFVGHPFADAIPLESDTFKARELLGLHSDRQYIALLPGSRHSELKKLTQPFVEAAKLCYQANPSLAFIVPMVSEEKRQRFEEALKLIAPELPVTMFVDKSQTVMAAADVVLLASGTATLEAMLLGKPMVVAYKLHPVTYWLAKRLVKLEMFSLPNLLLNKKVVPELIQQQAMPQALADAVMYYLSHPSEVLRLQQQFTEVHRQLKRNANETAALAIKSLIQRKM